MTLLLTRINVPNVPGVPALPSYADPTNEASQPAQLLDIAPNPSPDWGVYDQNGNLALDPDNIIGIEYQVESRIADYPMEEGGFATYNKVATPKTVRVVMSKGSSVSDRRDFAAQLERIQPDLNLYNIVTPDMVYLDMNVETIGLSRSQDHGAGMLQPEIRFREIRTTAEIEFDSSQPDTAAQGSDNPATDQPLSETQRIRQSFPGYQPPKRPVVRSPQNVAAQTPKVKGSVQPQAPSKLVVGALGSVGFQPQTFTIDGKQYTRYVYQGHP